MASVRRGCRLVSRRVPITVHTYPGRLVRVEKRFRGEYAPLVVGRLAHFRREVVVRGVASGRITMALNAEQRPTRQRPDGVTRTTTTTADGQWALRLGGTDGQWIGKCLRAARYSRSDVLVQQNVFSTAEACTVVAVHVVHH